MDKILLDSCKEILNVSRLKSLTFTIYLFGTFIFSPPYIIVQVDVTFVVIVGDDDFIVFILRYIENKSDIISKSSC